MAVTVRHSPHLLAHLRTFEVDGASVESLLFGEGRLLYPAGLYKALRGEH